MGLGEAEGVEIVWEGVVGCVFQVWESGFFVSHVWVRAWLIQCVMFEACDVPDKL